MFPTAPRAKSSTKCGAVLSSENTPQDLPAFLIFGKPRQSDAGFILGVTERRNPGWPCESLIDAHRADSLEISGALQRGQWQCSIPSVGFVFAADERNGDDGVGREFLVRTARVLHSGLDIWRLHSDDDGRRVRVSAPWRRA